MSKIKTTAACIHPAINGFNSIFTSSICRRYVVVVVSLGLNGTATGTGLLGQCEADPEALLQHTG